MDDLQCLCNGRQAEREILRELDIHGAPWENLHGGYFTDPVIASPFIKRIKQMVKNAHPEVLVDLAGGPGYILNCLMNTINPDTHLVNIDLSAKQLFHQNNPRISKIQSCISDFKRSAIGARDKRVLFIMRSAFHYFGKDGIKPLLQNLWSQMKKGEIFIHQSASFAFRKDSCCINDLYKQMGTEKWYPTVRELRNLLKNAGWSTLDVFRAPELPLSSEDLMTRYGLSRTRVMQMRKDLINKHGEIEGIFMKEPDGFCAYLHYYIYTCVAV